MELTMAGVGFTGFFAAVVFVAFAFFSFLAIFSGGKYSLDKLGKSFSISLRLRGNVIAFLSVIVAIVFLLIMSLVGSALSALFHSAIPGVIFMIFGVVGLIYVLFASAYILNYIALIELRDNKRVTLGEALGAWMKQQFKVMLLPAILVGIILVEMGIMLLIGELRSGEGLLLVSALFYLPFLPLNIILFTLLFLGSGLYLPIMIDQNTGPIATFKAVATVIKQQVIRLLTTQVAVITLLGIVMVVMYLIFEGATSIGAQGDSQSPILMITNELLKDPFSILGDLFTASPLVAIGGLLLLLIVLLVLSVGIGFVWTLNMCLYAGFYLGYIKDSVDFKAPLFEKQKK